MSAKTWQRSHSQALRQRSAILWSVRASLYRCSHGWLGQQRRVARHRVCEAPGSIAERTVCTASSCPCGVPTADLHLPDTDARCAAPRPGHIQPPVQLRPHPRQLAEQGHQVQCASRSTCSASSAIPIAARGGRHNDGLDKPDVFRRRVPARRTGGRPGPPHRGPSRPAAPGAVPARRTRGAPSPFGTSRVILDGQSDRQ